LSEFIEAILDGLEEGVKIYDRLLKLSKQVEKITQPGVYTDSTLYKGKMKTVGDSPPQHKRPSKSQGNIIEMEQGSKDSYHVKEKKSK